MFATFIAGRLMIRTSYRLSAAIGGVALLSGGALFLMMTPESSVGFAATASLVMGIGMGFCNQAFLVSIQASVDWSQRGVATAANMFMRILGQSTGASLFGAIVNFGVAHRLPGAGDAVNRLLEPNLRQGLGADEIARLTSAVAASVHEVYLVVVAIAAATLAIALAFPAGLRPTHTERK
jgi:MFS family permease